MPAPERSDNRRSTAAGGLPNESWKVGRFAFA
jgi:hypothetical protein